jgi:hypothetical protein
MTITKKGYELAAKLSPGIGYTDSIAETCPRIQDSQHGTEGPLSCKGNFTVTLAGCGRITWC